MLAKNGVLIKPEISKTVSNRVKHYDKYSKNAGEAAAPFEGHPSGVETAKPRGLDRLSYKVFTKKFVGGKCAGRYRMASVSPKNFLGMKLFEFSKTIVSDMSSSRHRNWRVRLVLGGHHVRRTLVHSRLWLRSPALGMNTILGKAKVKRLVPAGTLTIMKHLWN